MNKTASQTPADYIRIDSLPPEQREAFEKWIFHQTRPVVPAERDKNMQPARCAYLWDYERWLAEGKPHTLPDPFDT